MATEKTIYGQAWISDNKLLQDQTTFGIGYSYTRTVVLIDDVKKILTTDEGVEYTGDDRLPKEFTNTYFYFKRNGRKPYFFFIYKMNSLDSDDIINYIKLDCPKPKEDTFDEVVKKGIEKVKKGVDPETGEDKYVIARDMSKWEIPSGCKSEYSKYWIEEMKRVNENVMSRNVLKVKDIDLKNAKRDYYINETDVISTGDNSYSTSTSDLAGLLGLY